MAHGGEAMRFWGHTRFGQGGVVGVRGGRSVESECGWILQVYAAAGTVQNNYVNILWMLLRLRQACDHPMLVKKCQKSEAFHKTTLEAVRKLPPPQRAELIQCLEGGQMICHICQVFCEDVQCSDAWG